MTGPTDGLKWERLVALRSLHTDGKRRADGDLRVALPAPGDRGTWGLTRLSLRAGLPAQWVVATDGVVLVAWPHSEAVPLECPEAWLPTEVEDHGVRDALKWHIAHGATPPRDAVALHGDAFVTWAEARNRSPFRVVRDPCGICGGEGREAPAAPDCGDCDGTGWDPEIGEPAISSGRVAGVPLDRNRVAKALRCLGPGLDKVRVWAPGKRTPERLRRGIPGVADRVFLSVPGRGLAVVMSFYTLTEHHRAAHVEEATHYAGGMGKAFRDLEAYERADADGVTDALRVGLALVPPLEEAPSDGE